MKAVPHDRIISTQAVGGAGRRKTLLLIITLIALMVGGGTVVYLYRASPYAISSEVAARLDPKVQMTARRLVNERCNRSLAADLVRALQDQAEYAEIIAFVQQTNAKCGLNEELLTDLLIAQWGSSDLSGAEGTANQLVAQYPADPKVYGWRAQIWEKQGNLVGAYTDRRTELSLVLDPSDVDLLSVYYDVARLAANTGHPCDAVATLRDYLAYDQEKRRTPRLATLMRGWQQAGSCAPLLGIGSFYQRFGPNETVKVVSVLVNGVRARMMVDTGSTRTLLSRELARRAGIEPTEAHIVYTANGEALKFGGRADTISLDGAQLSSVPVFIEASTSSSFGRDLDGLLGQSFLNNFRSNGDQGFLQLSPRE